jgi:phosphoglycolate phosphatase
VFSELEVGSFLSLRLIVFDLDGTLIDSLGDLTDSANELLARHGARPLADGEVAGMIGDGVGRLVRRVLEARRIDREPRRAVDEFLDIYDRRLLDRTRAYDGIPEALEALRTTARLGVLTNKPGAAAERILQALGLRPPFDWVIGGDGPYGRKPRPDGLQAMMRAAACEPDATVLVGDSAIDVETARAAGARVCLARYGFGFPTRPPETLRGDELFVDRPQDLPAVLGR